MDNYERMVALYRGPFLADEESNGWADHRRERLRQAFIQAVGTMSDSQNEKGRHEQALVGLEHALKVDPLAEPLYPRLIKLLQSVGRQDAAKTVWAHYRQTFTTLAGRKSSVEMDRLAKTLPS